MKSCSWWLASDPGCAHLAVRITRAEKVGSSRQAKPREGSFWRQWKVTFLIFLPKPSFRKITLWCLFLVTLSSVRSCELYLPFIWHWLLSFPRHLSRRAGVSRCFAVRGHGWGTAVAAASAALLSQPVPTPVLSGRTKALHLYRQPHCTAVRFLTFQSVHWGAGKA